MRHNLLTFLVKFYQKIPVPRPSPPPYLSHLPPCCHLWPTRGLRTFFIWKESQHKAREQDNTLHEQIEAINQVIHTLNREQGVRSPLLTVHLRARKKVKRGKNKPTKDIINFNLLSDGIHPSPLLAKVWLKEISMRISVDCD